MNYKKRPIRIQVKSSLSKDYNAKRGGKPRYNFMTSLGIQPRKYTQEDTDIIALVGMEDETIIFKLVDEVKTKTMKMSEANFYNKAITQESFERCLSHVSVIR